jgi:hypothetical protein
MGRGERVRQLKYLRETALGIGTRKLKLRLNKLAQDDPLAQAARLALEIEDANVTAKRYGPRYADRNYYKKQGLMRDLIALFRREEWLFGVHASDVRPATHVIYFEIPGCEQISFHYTPEERLPEYPKPWDGKQNSTLLKLIAFLDATFPELKTGNFDRKTQQLFSQH